MTIRARHAEAADLDRRLMQLETMLTIRDRRHHSVAQAASADSADAELSRVYQRRSWWFYVSALVLAGASVVVLVYGVVFAPQPPPAKLNDIDMLFLSVSTDRFEQALKSDDRSFYRGVLQHDSTDRTYFVAQWAAQREPERLKAEVERLVREEAMLSARASPERLVSLQLEAFGEVRSERARSHLARLPSAPGRIKASWTVASLLLLFGCAALWLSIALSRAASGRVASSSALEDGMNDSPQLK